MTSSLLTLLLTLSMGGQTAAPNQPVGIALERPIAQDIWDHGTGFSVEVFDAVKLALRDRRPIAEVRSQQEKRCLQRDSGGAGPSHECLRKIVVLELTEAQAREWLLVLRSDEPLHLTAETGQAIEEAFRREGFR